MAWLTVSEVHYYCSGRNGGMQADMVLEKELRALHFDPKAARRRLSAALGVARA